MSSSKCPICGSSSYKVLTTETFKYKGYQLSMFDYIILRCNNLECREEIVPKSTMKEAENVLREFKDSVDRV